jgi:putative phage-type endonuclease
MISATNISILMGISPFKTALMLYEEKMGYREPEKMNCKMSEGMMLESHALAFFNKQNKSDFQPIVLQHGNIPYLMASLDGMNSEGKILEIKCGKGSHELAKQGVVPNYYFSQVQCQLFCSNATQAHYFSYRSDEDNVTIIVHRDDEFIEKMKVAVAKFYDMMMTFTPPDAVDRDFIKQDSKAWLLHTEIYKETVKQRKLLEAKEECLRNEIIELCDGQSSQGNGIRVSKTLSKGRIKYDAIPELKDIDLEKYRGKNVISYRFTEIKQE